MNYNQALDYLHNTCKPSAKPGLGRTEKIIELLGNPDKKIKTIHVAGTNGKGSTSAILLSILQEAGYKVGFYSSPHLHSYTERMSINRVAIDEDRFAQYINQIQEQVIPKLLEEGLDHPSEFEVLTGVGLQYFCDEQVDIAIIEVGLGGRWDATNVITPIISVITPVSIDHCNFLGNTIEGIAREKGGIIKEGIPLILAPQQRLAKEEIIAIANRHHAPITEVTTEQYQLVSKLPLTFNAQVGGVEYHNVEVGLRGRHQVMNSTVAIAVANCLIRLGWSKINHSAIIQGVRGAQWPGRQELFIIEKKRVLIDGAHNQAGIDTLVQSLQDEWIYNKLVLVLGILDDKDKEGMMKQLAPLTEVMYITKPNSLRAKHWKQLAEIAKKYNSTIELQIMDNHQDAIDQAFNKVGENDLLCITGSLYLIGDCRTYLIEKDTQFSFRSPKSIQC